MKAMLLRRICLLGEVSEPLELAEVPMPEPVGDEVLIKVLACGVCHTELDEIEGRTAPPVLPVIPGHEVIGIVEQCGPDTRLLRVGDRVGVGWIHSSSGDEDENLSTEFRATGRDANGGYAEYMTVRDRYAYPVPEVFNDIEAAPLLCAGAVGYRALKLTNLVNGQSLGLMGFGGSAHIVIQLAKHLFPASPVSVFARHEEVRQFAKELGAAWAGDVEERVPTPLDAIIDTTPVWKPIVESLRNLAPGGRLVINAIRKESFDQQALLELNYHDDLWMEREIKTVANVTHHDIGEFLKIAGDIPIKPTVEVYPLEEANRALVELKEGRIQGAKVLRVGFR
ncbi:MAG: alcohol dehydrogenase [Planctomyces sp.]|nr:alcohol dehydrogenase [Planctomyces sp.]